MYHRAVIDEALQAASERIDRVIMYRQAVLDEALQAASERIDSVC